MPDSLKLLLVEDSEPVRSRLIQMLKREHLLVTSVTTVAEAIAALREDPDLLSVDLNLPDGCGTEIIKQAKARTKPPVVFVLSGRLPEMTEACVRSGADRVFDKATQLPDYLHAVEHEKQRK